MEPSSVPPGGVRHSPAARVGAGRTLGPAGAWTGLVVQALARSYRAFLLTLVLTALAPMLWSWTSYVVRSGSMTPALAVGDVVVGMPFPATSEVPTGRVMVFKDPARDRTLIHRVVERMGDGTFTTAGDANASVDSTPVPRENFIARAAICVPFVGLPLVWLQDRDITRLLGWSVVTVLALLLAERPPVGRRRRRRRRTELPPDGSPSSSQRAVPLGRTAVVAVGAGAVAAGLVATPGGYADAAFSARTVNSGSSWTVAINTSKVISQLQVYDTATPSGWYQRASVSVNVYATASPGSSVRSITYRINGGTPVTTSSASVVFTLATQGDNTITYNATDGSGGVEAAHTAHVKLDNQVPSLVVTSPTGDLSHAQWQAACAQPGSSGGMCGTAQDGLGSGVATVQYTMSRTSDQRCFDGDKWTGAACMKRTSGTFASGIWFVSVPDARLEVPRTWYTITVFVTDIAGNVSSTSRNFSVG